MEVDEAAVAQEPTAAEQANRGDAAFPPDDLPTAASTVQEGERVSEDEDDNADDDEEQASASEPAEAGLADTVPCLEEGCGRMFKSIIALKRHAAVHRKKKRSARPPGSTV